MGKSLSFDSARARSEKQQEEVSRRAAPDARERILERIPTGAGGAARSYYFYGAYQRSTLTRNKGLLVSPFLELFLDRSDAEQNQG